MRLGTARVLHTCDIGGILPMGPATYGWVGALTVYLGALV